MRKLAMSLAVLAALSATSAMAATTTTTTTPPPPAKPAPVKTVPAPLTATGAIVSIDAKACTITLAKTAYHFAAKCDLSKLKVAENVTLTYKVRHKIDWVTKIAAVPAA